VICPVFGKHSDGNIKISCTFADNSKYLKTKLFDEGEEAYRMGPGCERRRTVFYIAANERICANQRRGIPAQFSARRHIKKQSGGRTD
jgi:hypothetical protein